MNPPVCAANAAAWRATPAARAACTAADVLRSAGHSVLFAGGCVRDILLGLEPKDFDLATDATPEAVEKLFPGAHTVGKSFGVVRVAVDTVELEIATFRQDGVYEDGRHPERVVYSDPPHDARRRDFTINALFLDPANGAVLDYVDGLADLRDGVIRCVGDPLARFREDRLRMLRAVRFVATLDFRLDPAAAVAIRAEAAALRVVSPERLRDELVRALCEARAPGDALRLLDELGLLAEILPEVSALKHQDQPPEFHPEGDVLTHTVGMLNRLERRTPELAMAVLLHDVGKPPTAVHDGQRWRFNTHAEKGADMARDILRRLRFPHATIDTVATVIRGHMRFQDAQKMRPSTLRRWMGSETFALEMELHRLDCLASHGDLGHYEFLRRALAEYRSEPVLPEPWITGRDLLALGVPPGPELGRIKQEAYDAQLEGRFADRDKLLAWASTLRSER